MKLRKLGIAFSLSHLMLCFFFILSTGNGYVFPTEECSNQLGAFLVLLTLFSLVFYKLLFSNHKIINLVYILCIYIVFRGIKAMFRFQFGANLKSAIFLTCISVIFFSLLYFFQKNRKKFVFLIQNTLLFFVPFGLISVFKLSANLFALQKVASLKECQNVQAKPKIFWVIFDELDQYFVFDCPKRPNLKELNLLKSKSVYATKAVQAGSCTNNSLPAFTTGLFVKDTILNGPFNLTLALSNGSSVDWKSTSNIFKKAYGLGYNSALIGWYHPYDRIFTSDLAYLKLESSFSNDNPINSKFISFLATALNQFFTFLSYNFNKPIQILTNKSLIPNHIIQTKHSSRNQSWYNNLLKSMENVIDNDYLNFNFFHLPIPHYPTCYNSKTHKIEITKTNYYENVILVDKTLGWLRKKLEEKGLWDQSVIIVTSDHWLRDEKGFVDKYLDQESEEFKEQLGKRKAAYVPFLIKMPGQQTMIKIDKEFSSIILHDLVLKMMSQDIKTTNDLVNRINESFDH